MLVSITRNTGKNCVICLKWWVVFAAKYPRESIFIVWVKKLGARKSNFRQKIQVEITSDLIVNDIYDCTFKITSGKKSFSTTSLQKSTGSAIQKVLSSLKA